MTKEQLKKAVELNESLNTLNEILKHINEYDKDHWWSFLLHAQMKRGSKCLMSCVQNLLKP